jgi:uncharacterized membrane protein HdeD (DUF308 family)
MTTLATSSPQAPSQPSPWKWFLALGVLLLLLGLAGAGVTTLLELSSLLVFGPMLVASSLLQLLIALFSGSGKERLLHLASAGLEAFLGFLIMAHPLMVADLVVLIAAVLMVSGVLRLARSLVTPAPRRGWALLAGSATLILGVCVWLKVPVTGLWFVGLCLALDFLCHGISWTAIGLAAGKTLEDRLP